MSVEETRGAPRLRPAGRDRGRVSDERFRGLRIFDISDLTAPVQVGAVQTCRGSHTHSVVSADDERIVVYNSGTSGIRDQDELEAASTRCPATSARRCSASTSSRFPWPIPAGAHRRQPGGVRRPETGALAGLWRGGDHGDGTQEPRAPTSATTSPCSPA
jgi:hypothetical protein